ncbi:hypothetical protein K8I85_11160 [bacterium]|nr:hypothetical protein [bacterium]
MGEHVGEERRRVARTPRGRWIRHLILSIVLWITYLVYWRVVLARGVEREATLALGLLALFAILQFAATQAWVAHNRLLHRRHGNRREARRARPSEASTDFLGRTVHVMPPGTDLTSVPYLVVRTSGEDKWIEAELRLDRKARGA